MKGLPHKVNPRLTLWLMPECLASRGCIGKAGRDFSPGLKSHAIGFSRWVTKTLPGLQPLTKFELFNISSFKFKLLEVSSSLKLNINSSRIIIIGGVKVLTTS